MKVQVVVCVFDAVFAVRCEGRFLFLDNNVGGRIAVIWKTNGHVRYKSGNEDPRIILDGRAGGDWYLDCSAGARVQIGHHGRKGANGCAIRGRYGLKGGAHICGEATGKWLDKKIVAGGNMGGDFNHSNVANMGVYSEASDTD